MLNHGPQLPQLLFDTLGGHVYELDPRAIPVLDKLVSLGPLRREGGQEHTYWGPKAWMNNRQQDGRWAWEP